MRPLLLVLLLVACSPAATAPSNSPTTAPSTLAAGCGSSPVLTGHQPRWLVDAGANNNPDGPYVVASPPIAAGFIFGYPLRAGHPTNPSNKILWVVGKPRDGTSLQITGHPAASVSPVVTQSVPDNSGPGEIYPSSVDVPTSGCWHFDLTWAGNHASVDLAYQ